MVNWSKVAGELDRLVQPEVGFLDPGHRRLDWLGPKMDSIQREDLLEKTQASNSSPCSATKALSARARSVTSSSPVPQAPSARLPQHHRIMHRRGGIEQIATTTVSRMDHGRSSARELVCRGCWWVQIGGLRAL